jgi:uncharacterized protein
MTDGAAENLRDRLSRALPVAMKARDRLAVTALRSALAAIANAEAIDSSRAPPQAGHPEPTGSAPGFGGSGVGDPEPAGSGSDPPFAGTVVGLGAAEVERRSLTEAQVEEIVRAEVAERETAAADFTRAGQLEHAERLRDEAEVLAAYLEGT